jgi:tetratricopeptide (TPR) repeat protein
MRRPLSISMYLVLLGASLVLTVLGSSRTALAQFAAIETPQSDLVKKSAAEQSAILAKLITGSWKDRGCSGAKVSLEKIYNNASGGWLVLCEEGLDYWAVVPDRAKSTASVLPCILAREAGGECYAKLQSVLPEDIKQCAPPSGSLDRVIRSCTAIIQSHRFDNRPEIISVAYVFRAVAFGGYNKLDLAIADFDKAVALQPDNIDIRYNRAVSLERKGEFDQALLDLAKVIEARPNDLNGLYERGNVFMKKGDYDRAISDFDLVLRIDPRFEKAISSRAAAVKIKENPVQPGPKVAAAEMESLPTTPDQRAAYCMEASFGFVQQWTKLLAILRDNRDKGQALLGGANVSQVDRAQLVAQMTALNTDIASSDTKRKAWDANLQVFMSYLQGHGLLNKLATEFAPMSAQVRKDQETVQSTYRACLRGCAPDDASCKSTCNQKADSSDASMRMLRCGEVVTNFK